MIAEREVSATTWFVGAMWGGSEDQTSRFVSEGIWENGYEDKLQEEVRSMRPGDHIAIKSSYTRKHDLPFDNRGNAVSVMAIKAVGKITRNFDDGRQVQVAWEKNSSVREWYFYTHRGTIWRVLPGDWKSDALIAFAFKSKPQDIDRFCNAPHWRERFGTAPEKLRFKWTRFYEAVADKLLRFRNDRPALIAGLRVISERLDGLGYLDEDRYADGSKGFLRDICPFTAMGTFNRGITETNRKRIAAELASFLKVDEPIPESFEGIPVLNNLKSWFFPFEVDRASDHIDALWAIFAAGIAYADSEDDDEASRNDFAQAFDKANGRPGVAWNLTLGCYWIRPWRLLSLDQNSQTYVTRKLAIPIEKNGPKKRCNSADYLSAMDILKPRFEEPTYPVHSFPELSLEAWQYRDPSASIFPEQADEDNLDSEASVRDNSVNNCSVQAPLVPYVIDDILNEGCFLERNEIERLIGRVRLKKNLILQGPPGTGKTWLAKRLAFALIGRKDESKIWPVQFHPNLSYEDFIRGWRPSGEGKLSLADGVFMEAIKSASRDASSAFVVVIEEINRGNPAQIFGEMLTLLEAGKRTPNEALKLCYPDADGAHKPVHIPENLYVIGTMNIADRSLALVDFALRRRFAFVTLEPKLGEIWRKWVISHCGIDADFVHDIERRISDLNQRITNDLGTQFRIGHSYVTPTQSLESGATKKWFKEVVETEIGPLLDEYWFDSPKSAKEAFNRLIEGWS